MTRQEKWLDMGYTQEQIDNHLSFERYKAKKSREQRNKNNEKNKETIAEIKKNVVGKTFSNKWRESTVLSINPSTDGYGFWYKVKIVFPDKSEGEFRYFYHFSDYSEQEFIHSLLSI